MPKMKALRKDEDLAAVPLDQPVLVDLEPAVTVEEPEAEAEPAESKSEDPGITALKEQMKAMEEATKRANERAVAAEREAERAHQERQAAVTNQARTEEEAIQSGLSAAQAEQASAKAAFKSAFEAGDADAMAEAQARIGRTASDIREFERSAALLAERKEAGKAEPQIQRQLQPIDVLSAIEGNPALLPSEKDWLKRHPEAYSSRNKELDVAYSRAMDRKLSRGTPEYFKYMDEFMGYAQPAQHQEEETMHAAPPSRNERGSDGRPTTSRIMLTPEQRDIAKSMGVSDIEYARQVAAFEQARKADPMKYGDR